MRDHVRLLGALYVAMGALGLLGAFLAMLILGGVAGILGTVATDEAGASLASLLIMAVATGIFLIVAIMSLPNIIAGLGLLRFQPWARVLALILSALNLLSIPLGTLLGVYGFWVLMSGDADSLFDTDSKPSAG